MPHRWCATTPVPSPDRFGFAMEILLGRLTSRKLVGWICLSRSWGHGCQSSSVSRVQSARQAPGRRVAFSMGRTTSRCAAEKPGGGSSAASRPESGACERSFPFTSGKPAAPRFWQARSAPHEPSSPTATREDGGVAKPRCSGAVSRPGVNPASVNAGRAAPHVSS